MAGRTLPNHNGLLEALRERGHTDKEITEMDAMTMFTEWAEWNGLLGWAGMIHDVMYASNQCAHANKQAVIGIGPI